MPIRQLLALLLAGLLTVAATATPAAAALPLSGVIIALDPGHDGGNASHPVQINRLVWYGTGWKPCDTVGTTTRDGYTEHRFNLQVALRVKARLVALGATVYMTRSTDTGVGPCVDYRGRFGQRVHAMLKVSVHADGSARTDRGFVVLRPAYIRGFTDDIYSRSYALAKAMRTGMLRAGLPIANYYAINGIRTRSDFANFNLANAPSILVETGNMKNASDARRMKSSAGRDQYAAGLVNGIRLYLGR